MDPKEDRRSFVHVLEKMRSGFELTDEGKRFLTHMRREREKRQEVPVPHSMRVITSLSDLVKRGDTDVSGRQKAMYYTESGRHGLKEFGWSESPMDVQTLGQGSHGTVRLVYRVEDASKAHGVRHYAALKTQPIEDSEYGIYQQWAELCALRAVQHPNIIDFYGAFIVLPQSLRPENAAVDPDVKDELWILMEYADAGSMKTELLTNKFPNQQMPEPVARYYMMQVCGALAYLHGKGITHHDVKADNVLLKYAPNGSTKYCLLADFGWARIVAHGDRMPKSNHPCRKDVRCARNLLYTMVMGVHGYPREHLSPDFSDLMKKPARRLDPDIETMAELMAHKWFTRAPRIAPRVDVVSSPDPGGHWYTAQMPVSHTDRTKNQPPIIDRRPMPPMSGRGRFPRAISVEPITERRPVPASGRGRFPRQRTESSEPPFPPTRSQSSDQGSSR